MDLVRLFCDVDDFCQSFEPAWKRQLLPATTKKRQRKFTLTLSEVMTIVIAFQDSAYRTFKDYYIQQVSVNLRSYFPSLVSYNRFVELKKIALIPMLCYLYSRKGRVTGISFIDSTPIEVCHPKRAKRHKVFEGLAQWGKNSVGWYFGFKLHLVINEVGELLSFKLTTANTDDRQPLPDLIQGLFGKLFGDKGYISQKWFESLFEHGVQLVTPSKKNMKNRLIPLLDKILLRKRSLIETVNDQLKNICQIEHSRHRSVLNFMVNLVAGLIAYTYRDKKPSLNIHPSSLTQFNPTVL